MLSISVPVAVVVSMFMSKDADRSANGRQDPDSTYLMSAMFRAALSIFVIVTTSPAFRLLINVDH